MINKNKFAEEFGVSTRSIQKDIDDLKVFFEMTRSFRMIDIDSGSEEISNIGDATPLCYESLMGTLSSYGFEIDDNSSYDRVDMMSYDELISELSY